jgi:hypothetical protein
MATITGDAAGSNEPITTQPISTAQRAIEYGARVLLSKHAVIHRRFLPFSVGER